jgi:hypothetical protein
MKNKPILSALFEFIWFRKIWWITPIVVMLLLIGLLTVMVETSGVSVWVYALF